MLFHAAGEADRVVVVDTETTGVYNRDRIVEIAIVTLALNGDVIEEWDTLIHPLRDVGAFHIHGITASMVESAPSFADVIGDVAIRLDGACLAAHNADFDVRMLNSEFERADVPIMFGTTLDTLRAVGGRLGVACAQFGIEIDGAHQALGDARATAELLCLVADRVEPGSAIAASTAMHRSGRVLRRSDLEPTVIRDLPLIVHLESRLDFLGVEAQSLAYLDLLGRAIADLHLDRDERSQLRSLAGDLGLGAGQIAQAHRRFVNELTDLALLDREVTDDEYETLVRVAAALEVDQELVERRVRSVRTAAVAVELRPGTNVVFTGETEIPRSELTTHAENLGLVQQKNVTKATGLLVAADPSSTSGKAAKARRYQIPIMDAADFLAATAGQAVSADIAATLRVVTCPECLSTWVVPSSSGEHASRVCEDCVHL